MPRAGEEAWLFLVTADGMRPPPLTHNPFNALVMPRPIGWISTVNRTGQPNLAPFSYFNGVSSDPPYVMFAPNAKGPHEAKDTYNNLLEVPEFVVSLVSQPDLLLMNASSKPFAREIDEFAACGIDPQPSKLVRPPRVASAPAALECRVYDIVHLPAGSDGRQSHVVIGEVMGIFIRDDVIIDGKIDERRILPVTRLGYMNYSVLGDVFVMERPE